MSTLAEVLEFMHPGVSGIQTAVRDGREVIHRWPPGVARPTAQEIDTARTALDAGKEDAEAAKDINRDKLARLLFAVNFDQENRLRTLEGAALVTKAQYRNALMVRYKAL